MVFCLLLALSVVITPTAASGYSRSVPKYIRAITVMIILKTLVLRLLKRADAINEKMPTRTNDGVSIRFIFSIATEKAYIASEFPKENNIHTKDMMYTHADTEESRKTISCFCGALPNECRMIM